MNYSVDHCEPFDNKKENIWMKAEHIGRYLFAADILEGRKKIIDVACAEGFGSKILCDRGYDVYGADINMLYVMRATSKSHGHFMTLDFEKDNFPSIFAEADGCVCFETIEHLEKTEFFVKNIYGSLKDDGVLILSFPNAAYEKLDENGNNCDVYHKKIFSKSEIIKIFTEAGFTLTGEWGQGLCNMLCSANVKAKKENRLTQEQVDDMFDYDRTSLINLSYLIAYPDENHVDESYSYILRFIKKRKNSN